MTGVAQPNPRKTMATQKRGPFTVFLQMVNPEKASEMVEVKTLREASETVRKWIDGGNPSGEVLGQSQLGKHCGRVTVSKTGAEVARVSYNGRVWEPGTYPTPEITDLD